MHKRPRSLMFLEKTTVLLAQKRQRISIANTFPCVSTNMFFLFPVVLALLAYTTLIKAAVINGSPSHLFAKRQATCDAELGNPPLSDCMNALALMPNDATYALFVRNDVVAPAGSVVAARGGPWFFQARTRPLSTFSSQSASLIADDLMST